MAMAKVCRVCRLRRVFMVTLEDNNEEAADILKMLDCIVESSGLSSLPKFICYPCLDQLKITYNFQLKIQHLIDDNRKPSDEIDGSTPLQSDDDNLNDTRPFACNLCGRRFKVKEHYETHCKRHLEKGQQFRCLTCGLCFLLKQHLTQHKCPK